MPWLRRARGERGGHQQYLDERSMLGRPEAMDDGNGILGQLVGSKDVSREVAHRASAPMLDSNRDGSMVDDVIGMIGKVMGGR